MKLLINLYDDALIYYPNAFFLVLFFLSVLGIIFVSVGIIIISKGVKRVTEERKKISLVQIISVFFERNIIFFLQVIRVTFIRINRTLGYIESQTKKIFKKIRKEILIEE